MNICLFPGLRQQRLPTRVPALPATAALCLRDLAPGNANLFAQSEFLPA